MSYDKMSIWYKKITRSKLSGKELERYFREVDVAQNFLDNYFIFPGLMKKLDV